MPSAATGDAAGRAPRPAAPAAASGGSTTAGGAPRTARPPARAAPPSARRGRPARSARPAPPRSAASRWPAATSRTSTTLVVGVHHRGQPAAQVVADHAGGGLAGLRAIDGAPKHVGRVDDHHLDAQPGARRERLRLALVLGVRVGEAEPAAAVDVLLGAGAVAAARGRCPPRSRSPPRAARPLPRRPPLRSRGAERVHLATRARRAARPRSRPRGTRSRSRGRPAAGRRGRARRPCTASTSRPAEALQPRLVAVGHPDRPDRRSAASCATCAPMKPVAPVTQTVTTSPASGVVHAFVHLAGTVNQCRHASSPCRAALALARSPRRPPAAGDYVPGEVIVKYDGTATGAERCELRAPSTSRRSRAARAAAIEDGESVRRPSPSCDDPSVDYARAQLHAPTPPASPERPRLRRQWNLFGPFGIGMPEAWELAARSTGPRRPGARRGGARQRRGLRALRPLPARARPATRHFVKGYDFVGPRPPPERRLRPRHPRGRHDRPGHQQRHGRGGHRLRAKIMPLRVLDWRRARATRWPSPARSATPPAAAPT